MERTDRCPICFAPTDTGLNCPNGHGNSLQIANTGFTCGNCEAMQDMLNDARLQLRMLWEALNVPYEPHQTLFERMLEEARTAAALRVIDKPFPATGG